MSDRIDGVEAVLASLGRSPVLARFSLQGRERLARSGGWRSLTAGEVLFQAGDPGDAVYVVVEGEVEVRACRKEMVEKAVTKLDAPLVAALYSPQTATQLARR